MLYLLLCNTSLQGVTAGMKFGPYTDICTSAQGVFMSPDNARTWYGIWYDENLLWYDSKQYSYAYAVSTLMDTAADLIEQAFDFKLQGKNCIGRNPLLAR